MPALDQDYLLGDSTRGVRFMHPDAAMVVDMGGQDSKVIRMDADGRVEDFSMNDRCAAGTGSFLELSD